MRVLLILTALFSFSLSEAQVVSEQPDSITEETASSESGLHFFARGGVSLPAFFYDFEDPNLYDSRFLPGANIGVGMQLPLVRKRWLLLQPELKFIQKGMQAKVRYGEPFPNIYKTINFRHNYLAMPIQLMFRFHIRKVWMETGLGGFIAWGIGGKVHSHGVKTFDVYDVSGDPSVYSDKIGFRHFDTGFNWEFNVGIGKWAVGMSTECSLVRFHKLTRLNDAENYNFVCSCYLKYMFK